MTYVMPFICFFSNRIKYVIARRPGSVNHISFSSLFEYSLPACVTGLIRVQPYSSLCVSIARSIKVHLLPGPTFTSDC